MRLIGLIAAIAVAAGFYFQQSRQTEKSLPKLSKAVILPTAKALGHVDFVDHNGNAFSTQNLKGYWSILFFAFTNCPDICPTTMQTLKQVKQELSSQNKWGNYRVIMVSVDPERDTTERLGNYVPYFDEEFLGIRGDITTTTEFAKQMGILFVKRQTNNDFYDIDHSASLILVNPAGEMAGVITAPHNVEPIKSDLALLADHFAEDHKHAPAQITAQPHELEKPAMAMDHSNTPINKTSATVDIVIQDAWIRPAPPNAPSLAAYFKLLNESESDVRVVGVEASDFAMAMIHSTVMENDVATMKHHGELTIPASGEVTLAPMGTHIMLMQPNKAFATGDTTEITLITSDGSHLTQTIEIKQPEN